jgi:archaemetzincin
MADLALVPFHLRDSGELVESVAEHFARRWGLAVAVHPPAFDPETTLDARRGQYDAAALLACLQNEPGASRVLGITDADLCMSIFTFVIGLGQLGGRAAVVSTHRLRTETVGLPASPERLRERLIKEAVHELGHTLGLTHCLDAGCVMRSAAVADEVDIKGNDFVGGCREAFLRAKTALLRKATP